MAHAEPETGTVTMDVTKAIKDIKGGKVDFRVDKNGNLSFLFGKLSFSAEALDQTSAPWQTRSSASSPATVKGRYITQGDDLLHDEPRASRSIRPRSDPDQRSTAQRQSVRRPDTPCRFCTGCLLLSPLFRA